jgi:hypothetical protein
MGNSANQGVTPELRKWLDKSHAIRIVAEFRGVIAGKVKLKREDGSEILIPLEMLCDADQTWIKEMATDTEEEGC